MFNGILQYSTVKQFAVTNANTFKQICKIRPPISNTARKQLGIDCENLRTKYKNEHLPITWLQYRPSSYVPRLNKQMMVSSYHNQACKETRSYIITTKEGVQYRKPQTHLKSYQPQNKKLVDEHLLQNNHMQTVKTLNYNDKNWQSSTI